MKLDVSSNFQAFQVWKARALVFLSRDRPDVRKLLTWAEAQTKEGVHAGLDAEAGNLGVSDLAAVEFALHDGIRCIIRDSLLGRARTSAGCGCELWRSLTTEWSGAAPQLKDAKARSFQEPRRCKDMAELWSKLPAWERLGEEVAFSGCILPEWLCRVALEKLLPLPLLERLADKNEIQSVSESVSWVKTQMERARGVAQAAAFAPASGKDADGDVYMNSVQAAESSDAARWAVDEAMAAGDYDAALYALKGLSLKHI